MRLLVSAMKIFRFAIACCFSLLLIALSGPSVLAVTGSDTPVQDRWALVVGVSKFKNPTLNLSDAANDARDFADYLVKQGGFQSDHVKILTDENATQKAILTALGGNWLPYVAQPDDLVVIYVSSHGSPAFMDIAGVNYILAHDSDVDDLYATALEMQDLVGVLDKRLKSKRVFLILDACHSGGAVTSGGKGLARTAINAENVALGKGKVLLLSSEPGQVSWELKDRPNSIFTRTLIDTLSTSTTDTTLPDLFKRLKQSVLMTALRERGVPQTPVMKSTWSGRDPVVAMLPGSAAVTSATTTPAAVGTATIPTVSTTLAGSATVQTLPPNIAVLPVSGPTSVNIQQLPPEVKVLWGKITSPSELSNVPSKLTEHLFYELRKRFGDRVLGPRSINLALADPGTKFDTTHLSDHDLQTLAHQLQARYLITANIDELDWSTSVMANKYTAVTSATLISGETGKPLATVSKMRIHKAPFHGDITGGRKYFENQLMPEVSDNIVGEFKSALKQKD